MKFNYFLLPFSFLYGIGVRIRNILFDLNFLPTHKYNIPIISVGNLTVGGTGKTPMVEYLIRLLSKKYKIAMLSRGYKRKTSGFVLANEKSTSYDVGDEACQIKLKFPETIVAVDKNRHRGIQKLLRMDENFRPQIILLDDAFQHRYVQSSLSILVTDCNRLFFRDKLLPVGRLREPAGSSSRADMVVVSKCDTSLKPIECRIIKNDMNLKKQQPVFFTTIGYQKLIGIFPKECYSTSLSQIKKEDSVLLLSGIANPNLLIQKLKSYTDHLNVLTFPDHHSFKKKDIKKIQKKLLTMDSKKTLMICTEKDAARIRSNPYFPEDWRPYLYYLPIEIQFMFDKEIEFDDLIFNHIYTVENSQILQNKNE